MLLPVCHHAATLPRVGSPRMTMKMETQYMTNGARIVFFALAVVLGIASSSRAQTATGQITGVVTDSSGAVMTKVKVTVSNQQTGSQRETLTNEQGAFTVPLLPVGVYLVTAEQA